MRRHLSTMIGLMGTQFKEATDASTLTEGEGASPPFSRWHRRLAVYLGALAVVALVAPMAAWGFSVQGPRWPNMADAPVRFMISPDGSDDIADMTESDAIRRAFQTWQDVACSYLTFEEGTWTGMGAVQNDGLNRIFWIENVDEWPTEPGTLALTFTFYTAGVPQTITDSDMILNGVEWTWTTEDAQVGEGTPAAIDVETVVFHEVGHFFGLNHSNDPEAAMFPNNNKLIQRAPATDDVQGICALYSNGEPAPGSTGGGGPVGAPCTGGDDCASGLCIEDLEIQRNYCSAQCVATQANACPAGFTCEQGNDGNSYCLAPLQVDELCDQCSNGEQCATGLCVTVPNVNNLQPFCSQACDPTPGQPQTCPDGFQCVVARQAATLLGTCVPNTGICDPRGKGGQNERCYANGTCKAGHRCVEYYENSDLFFCFAECSIAEVGLNCGLPRSVCAPVANTMNTAACFTIATIGEPCLPEVCDNRSFCAWDETVGIDSALCYQICQNGQSDCPTNFQCQVFEGLPPVCVANEGFKAVGDACSSDAECESRTCRPFGNISLCTEVCQPSDPASCTPGLRCYAAPGGTTGFCGPQEIPNPADPTRRVSGVSEDFCACDRTNQCDEDCGCDPECEDSACSCGTVPGSNSGFPVAGLALLGAMMAFRRRYNPMS